MSDSTQYLIDIAAKMTGGDAAAGELTDIAARLNGAGNAASAFDAAMSQTRSALERAASASTAAGDAVKEGEAKYKQLETAAVRAAKAVEAASLKGGVPADLQQRATAAAAALRSEATALDQLKAKASAAATEQTRLAGAMKNLEAASKRQAGLDSAAAAAARGTHHVGKLKGALGDLGGPLGSLGQKAANAVDAAMDLAEVLGTGPGAIVAIVVAMAAAVALVTVAIGAAIVKTAVWAVGLADTNRNAALSVEALEKASDALRNVGSILPGVTRSTGLASEELLGLAKQLSEAKVSADDMPAALQAVAMAEAALGKGAAAKLIADLKSGKKTAGELAREMETKFGGIVQKKMLGLDSQAASLKRNLAATFGGLDIEPLLAGLSKLVALFDQQTASGQALKFIFEGLFQPLINGAAKVIPVIEALVLGFAIGALKMFIAFKPAIRAVQQFLGQDDTATTDALALAVTLGKGLAVALAAAAVTVVFLAGLFTLPLVGIGLLVAGAIKIGIAIKEAVDKAKAILSGFSLSAIGTQLIQGLASGITAGATAVQSAIKSVVDGAIKSAKSLLGIASPSKVFEGLGGHTAEGFAGGVEGGAGEAQKQLKDMVAPPTVAAGGGGMGGGGAVYNITINAPDGNAEGIAAAVRQALMEITRGQLMQLGAAPEPEPT